MPVVEVAARAGIAATTVRRMIWKKVVEARAREDSFIGYEVNVATLPPKYRVKFAAQLAPPPAESRLRPVHDDEAPGMRSYDYAGVKVRERAELRYEAVLSLRKARWSRQPGERLADVEGRWLRNFTRSHPGMKVSIRSAKAWDQQLRDGGGRIDALVDGNDGAKQRGVRIPPKAKQMFRDEYLRAHRPNIALIYENVVTVAKVKGWGEMPSYDTFWRYATKQLPKLVRKLLRDSADTPRAVLPHVRRDPTSVAAYHTIQSDIRQLDVPVRCDTGCDTCTGKKPKGHFPFWTAFVDIRSRRLLGSELSIATPTSDLILGVFRRITAENGLTRQVYIDNGANYRKAFGKALRKLGRDVWDGPSEEQMQARFAGMGVEIIYALPYNAQGKGVVERMFRTFRHGFDEDFEAYRGTLGQKSEFARELYYRPHELPTISDLAFLLRLAIEKYNNSPHSGRGMNGRTPDEVFYDADIRMPFREPGKGFAHMFFEPLKNGRIVGPNGVLNDGHVYRLASLQKHLEYFGERVDVRINPDDVRDAMIYDRRTGAYVCDARLDDEATYSTRDEITRKLIERVFSDGKKLLAMAKAHVEGARERLIEYRKAKIEYLIARAQEFEAARREAHTALISAGSSVAVIGPFSGTVRDGGAAAPIELTESLVTAILDADDAAAKPLCGVSQRTPRPRKKPSITGLRRHVGALKYSDIAKLLGVSLASLGFYRSGARSWPEGLQERFEVYERLRNETPSDITEVPAVA